MDLILTLLKKKNNEKVMEGTSRECALYIQKNSNGNMAFEQIRTELLKTRYLRNRSVYGYKAAEANAQST